MERSDSLYINVLDVPNIVAAIDLAEEQLLNGIDYAMSRNVVGEKTDDDTEEEVSLLEEWPVTKPQVKDSRTEGTDVYSIGADLVERRKLQRRDTNRATLKDSTVAAPKESAVITVNDEQVKHENGRTSARPGEVEFVGIKKAHGWNRSLQPGRSLLAKREANGEHVEEFRATNVGEAISWPVEEVSGPEADAGQPVHSMTAPVLSKPPSNGQTAKCAVSSERLSASLEKQARITPNQSRTDGRVGPKLADRRATGPKAAIRKVSKPVVRSTTAPNSVAVSAPKLRLQATEPALHGTYAGSSEEPRALMRSIPSKNSNAELQDSDPTPQQLAQMAIPGVMYVPNAKVFGTALPNGYKVTAEGLRPVVTLDPRPRVPLQLRQTIADKLFQTLAGSGMPEMEAIVQSIMTEQRLYGSSVGRIDYKSASMMELARVRHETAAAAATLAAEAEEAQESVSAT